MLDTKTTKAGLEKAKAKFKQKGPSLPDNILKHSPHDRVYKTTAKSREMVTILKYLGSLFQ